LGKPFLKIHDVKTARYPYVGVEVSAAGSGPLEKLDESNFAIFENGWRVGFFRVKKADPQKNPKKISLLIDASKSLSTKAFKAQIDAAQMLVNGIYSNDEVMVTSFSDTAQTHCGFTNSREQLKKCLSDIKQGGKKTVLYDALYKALAMNASKTGREFIILFTDGKEEKSVFSLKDINDQIHKGSLPVFTLFAASAGNKNSAELARISEATGGEIYNAPDVASIVKIYQLLGSLMDSVYELEYISQARAQGETLGEDKTRGVRLEIRMENASIRDQDITEFRLPEKTFLMSLKGAFGDERFIIFLGSSFLLILVVIFISHFSSHKVGSLGPGRSKKEKPAEAKESNETFPFFQMPPEMIQNTVSIVKKGRFAKSENGKIVEEDTPVQDKYFAYVIEKEGPHTGRTSKIKWNVVTIGHGNENTIVIDDQTVSYNHAKIVMKDGEFYLHDMISESGVYLNGKKLLRPKKLNDFDEISLGRTKLLFRQAGR